jgi:hypothetical protein
MTKIIDVEASFIAWTPKAICVSAENFPASRSRDTIWLPLSQVEVFKRGHDETISARDGLVRGDQLDISLPQWLALEKGMI